MPLPEEKKTEETLATGVPGFTIVRRIASVILLAPVLPVFPVNVSTLPMRLTTMPDPMMTALMFLLKIFCIWMGAILWSNERWRKALGVACLLSSAVGLLIVTPIILLVEAGEQILIDLFHTTGGVLGLFLFIIIPYAIQLGIGYGLLRWQRSIDKKAALTTIP